jgi:hypothetical protein
MASTVSTPTTNTVLSLVAASAFGWEPVIKTDVLGHASVLVSIFFSFASERQEGENVREATSVHLSDAVIVSSSEDPTVRRADESGNEVCVPLAG